jgi:3-hydroxybutyryl-CoA dehydrogenase
LCLWIGVRKLPREAAGEFAMRVAVLGAGLMGHALALVYALGGHMARVTDSNSEVLARAPQAMRTALATLREGGEVEASWTDARLDAAVRCCATLAETLDQAELIVEAISEQPEAKRALYTEIDARAPIDAILASNTSALNIFPLVPQRRQSHTLIAHWYSPPYLVDLCDIVGSEHTDPAVIEKMRGIVAAMGKSPVVMKKFIPGYIANRVQGAIWLEVTKLLDEGYATAKDIDDAIIHGLALRMPLLGHLAKADFMGLMLIYDGMRNATYQPPEQKTHSTVLDALVAAGRTGVLAGGGYFDWSGRDPAALFAERDRKLLALKQALRGIGPLQGG